MRRFLLIITFMWLLAACAPGNAAVPAHTPTPVPPPTGLTALEQQLIATLTPPANRCVSVFEYTLEHGSHVQQGTAFRSSIILDMSRQPNMNGYLLNLAQVLIDEKEVDFPSWVQEVHEFRNLEASATGRASITLEEPSVGGRLPSNFKGRLVLTYVFQDPATKQFCGDFITVAVVVRP